MDEQGISAFSNPSNSTYPFTDDEWLTAINSERYKVQDERVSSETFEIIIDRLEKEWFDLVSELFIVHQKLVLNTKSPFSR
jgi:hypothetical protein